MVIHDSNLQRLSGENVNVYDLTAKELGELTLFQNDAKGKISTLEEVIKATKGQIKLLIELKTHGHETADVAAETAKVVEAQNDEKNCMFMSLDYSLVEQLKTLHPEYTVGYCVYGNLGKADTRRLVNMDIDFQMCIRDISRTDRASDTFLCNGIGHLYPSLPCLLSLL